MSHSNLHWIDTEVCATLLGCAPNPLRQPKLSELGALTNRVRLLSLRAKLNIHGRRRLSRTRSSKERALCNVVPTCIPGGKHVWRLSFVISDQTSLRCLAPECGCQNLQKLTGTSNC